MLVEGVNFRVSTFVTECNLVHAIIYLHNGFKSLCTCSSFLSVTGAPESMSLVELDRALFKHAVHLLSKRPKNAWHFFGILPSFTFKQSYKAYSIFESGARKSVKFDLNFLVEK